MNTFHETEQFAKWLEALRDLKGKARIMARINMAKADNFGNYKVLDDGICEMKIDVGPGLSGLLCARGFAGVSTHCWW